VRREGSAATAGGVFAQWRERKAKKQLAGGGFLPDSKGMRRVSRHRRIRLPMPSFQEALQQIRSESTTTVEQVILRASRVKPEPQPFSANVLFSRSDLFKLTTPKLNQLTVLFRFLW
jgi:hypothetical protein